MWSSEGEKMQNGDAGDKSGNERWVSAWLCVCVRALDEYECVSTSFQPARSNIKICIEYVTSCNINSRWIDPLGWLWHGVSTARVRASQSRKCTLKSVKIV